MWHHLPEQQQRGSQMRKREDGTPPADAVADRAAQDHEQADVLTSPDGEPTRDIDYPADPVERRDGADITPDAPEPSVDWDARVEPERGDDEDKGD